MLPLLACGGDSNGSGFTSVGPVGMTAAVGDTGSDDDVGATSVAMTDDGVDTAMADSGSEATSVDPDSTGDGEGCLFCDAPNEQCIDDQCVVTCHGQTPDPCGPAQVCDVISGACVDAGATCSLSGAATACGAGSCGPGTVCNDQGGCLPIAPCADVACLDDGTCWGTSCSCERNHACAVEPDATALNGPFSTQIGDLEFEDDCTAWMVTLRSGVDFVRRLQTDGTLTEWAGVSNLNMGEVKVLKALTPPPGIAPGGVLEAPLPMGLAGEPALGGRASEVAITYTCCSTCGCQADPPQGVARLDEATPANPLPIVIVAAVTQGTGPYGNAAADAGPQGLTWGEDRVLYVGNSTANGNLDTADLDAGTNAQLTTFAERISAGAAISPVHLLLGTTGGTLHRYNTETNIAEVVAELGSGVTSLSLDAFDGTVYAGLADLRIIEIDPFAETTADFGMMPAIGRVTVSPNGQLWFVPIAFAAGASPLMAFELPSSF